MSSCPILNDMLQKGIIMKDWAGHLIRNDGSWIR